MNRHESTGALASADVTGADHPVPTDADNFRITIPLPDRGSDLDLGIKKIWQERAWSRRQRGITFVVVLCTWLVGALAYAAYKGRKSIVVISMICFVGLAFAALVSGALHSWLDKRIVVGVESPKGAFLGNIYFKPMGDQTTVKVLFSCKEGEKGFTAALYDGNCASIGSVQYPLKKVPDCSQSNRFDEIRRESTIPLSLKALKKRHFVVAIMSGEGALAACGSLDNAYDL